MLTLAILLAQIAAPAATCPAVDRARLLALGFEAFDQDMQGGWRPLNAAGCDREAADLIRDWSAAHPKVDAGRRGLLAWHEGQLRAGAGRNEAAIALWERSRRPVAEDAIGWNHYVDGSIAFLRRDRAGLEAARSSLSTVPKPPGYAPTGPNGKPRSVRWPLNLDVLDALRQCWDKPYRQAYGCNAEAAAD